MLDHNCDINVIVKFNLYFNMLFVVLLRIYQIGCNNIISILKYTYVLIRIPRFQECFLLLQWTKLCGYFTFGCCVGKIFTQHGNGAFFIFKIIFNYYVSCITVKINK